MRPKASLLVLLTVASSTSLAQEETIVRPGVKAVQRSVSKLPRAATLSLGGTPDWLAISDDAVWVANATFKAVQRVNPKTNSLLAKIEFPAEPCSGLAFAFDTLWVPLCGKPASLARVSPRANEIVATLPFGPADGEGSITASEDSVWLVTKTRQVVGTVQAAIPGHGGDISYAAGRVWATVFDVPLTMVYAESDEVLRQWVGPGGDAIRFGHGSLWLTDLRNGLLWRLVPPKP
jgi:virginiamycin B lyase